MVDVDRDVSSTAPTDPVDVLANGAKVLGELAVIPGASLIADGDVKGGVLHGAIGIAAAVVFGPIGWLAVAANSYSRSVSGRNVHQHFVSGRWGRHRDTIADPV
ncbi:MAG TPA: DUF6072 family protein [Thermoanaerobaculia bacterium]|jgi:hypothetical protein